MIKQEHRHRATRRRQRVRLKKILFCFIFFLPPQSNNRENLTTGGRPTAESVRRVSELHAKIHLFFSSLPSFLYLVIEPARSRSNKRHIFFPFWTSFPCVFVFKCLLHCQLFSHYVGSWQRCDKHLFHVWWKVSKRELRGRDGDGCVHWMRRSQSKRSIAMAVRTGSPDELSMQIISEMRNCPSFSLSARRFHMLTRWRVRYKLTVSPRCRQWRHIVGASNPLAIPTESPAASNLQFYFYFKKNKKRSTCWGICLKGGRIIKSFWWRDIPLLAMRYGRLKTGGGYRCRIDEHAALLYPSLLDIGAQLMTFFHPAGPPLLVIFCRDWILSAGHPPRVIQQKEIQSKPTNYRTHTHMIHCWRWFIREIKNWKWSSRIAYSTNRCQQKKPGTCALLFTPEKRFARHL